MENHGFPIDNQGMAGIVTALEADDVARIGGQEIHDLSLTFVSPLETDDDRV